jgi:hypothetical protein
MLYALLLLFLLLLLLPAVSVTSQLMLPRRS